MALLSLFSRSRMKVRKNAILIKGKDDKVFVYSIHTV